MRTSYGHKLRRIGLLGLAAACMAFAAGATTAHADDWRGDRGSDRRGWDDRGHNKHWNKHRGQRVVVVERPVPYYYAPPRHYYAPPPPVVVYQPPAYVYRPAPVYVPAGDSFSFNLTLRN
jgi:hypothetical protein